MLEHAWELGVPMKWVTGDSVYGDSPDLRAAIQAAGRWYVLALTGVIRCWLEPPPLEGPQEETGGRRAGRAAGLCGSAERRAQGADGGRGDRRAAQGAAGSA